MGDDLQLLRDWRSGNRAAGDKLFERHFPSVCRFFRNKVNDHMDDLIQRTFLACVESPDGFRQEGSFRSYILGVARNVLYRHYRDRRRHEDRFDPLTTSVFDIDPSPSKVAAHGQQQRTLLDALRRLPMHLQVALELYYWEDMTVPELSRLLQMPEGTIKSHIRRAKQLVHRCLSAPTTPDELTPDQEATLDSWAKNLRGRLLTDEPV